MTDHDDALAGEILLNLPNSSSAAFANSLGTFDVREESALESFVLIFIESIAAHACWWVECILDFRAQRNAALPFEVAVRAFLEFRIRLDVLVAAQLIGQNLCGFQRTLQRGRNNDIPRAIALRQLGSLMRLKTREIIEGNIGSALQATCRVAVGLAVTDEC